MKQQQAGVVQAWQAIRHGDEAVMQGRSIMTVTVMTVAFVSRLIYDSCSSLT